MSSRFRSTALSGGEADVSRGARAGYRFPKAQVYNSGLFIFLLSFTKMVLTSDLFRLPKSYQHLSLEPTPRLPTNDLFDVPSLYETPEGIVRLPSLFFKFFTTSRQFLIVEVSRQKRATGTTVVQPRLEGSKFRKATVLR